MKYVVVATVWSHEHGKQIKKVAGMFDDFANAKIFRDAYNKHYSAHAILMDLNEWLTNNL